MPRKRLTGSKSAVLERSSLRNLPNLSSSKLSAERPEDSPSTASTTPSGSARRVRIW